VADIVRFNEDLMLPSAHRRRFTPKTAGAPRVSRRLRPAWCGLRITASTTRSRSSGRASSLRDLRSKEHR
jgi:hypothetical protein